MANIYSYAELVAGVPASPAEVIRFANQIASLPALASGKAVLIGSAAWGNASWRSDVDVVAFDCPATADLRESIDRLRADCESRSNTKAPGADIILIGAEREELVERNNLVSGSAPILEPATVREIFNKVSIRLSDHLHALANAKGEPWRTFADSFAPRGHVDTDILDVLRDYSQAVAGGWKEKTWSPDIDRLTDGQLQQLGYADGFATHFPRLILSHRNAYPTPDRRADVRSALSALGELGGRIESLLEPFGAIDTQYEAIAARIRAGDAISRADFDRTMASVASGIDFDRVEEFVWSYCSTRGNP